MIRPDFALLDLAYYDLYDKRDLSTDKLTKIKKHLDYCKSLPCITTTEKAVTMRTGEWLRRRCEEMEIDVGFDRQGPAKKYELTTNDKRFLGSLRISQEDDNSDNNNGNK